MARTFRHEVTDAAIRLLKAHNDGVTGTLWQCPACACVFSARTPGDLLLHAEDCLDLRDDAVDAADRAHTKKGRRR